MKDEEERWLPGEVEINGEIYINEDRVYQEGTASRQIVERKDALLRKIYYLLREEVTGWPEGEGPGEEHGPAPLGGPPQSRMAKEEK